MPNAALVEARNNAVALADQIQAVFKKHDGDYTKLTDEESSEIQQKNAEFETLTAKIGKLVEDERIDRETAEFGQKGNGASGAGGAGVGHSVPGEGSGQEVEHKSIGEQLVQSKQYQERLAGNISSFSIDIEANFKDLMSTTAGFAPQVLRTGVVVPSAQPPPRILDIIPMARTDQTAVKYMLETVFDNEAGETAEAGQYHEVALAYEEEISPVRKVTVFLPVTDEQLSDQPGTQERVNGRLTLMLQQALDREILNGDGTAPNLLGMLQTTGIQTYAQGTAPNTDEPIFDAVLRAMTLVRTVAWANPDTIVMNPQDWQTVRLAHTTTGIYLFGSPSDPGVAQLWGLPVIQSVAIDQGNALVGDFKTYTELDYKQDIQFEISNSHADFFQYGKQAIRASLRAAIVVYRPAALCEVTGLGPVAPIV